MIFLEIYALGMTATVIFGLLRWRRIERRIAALPSDEETPIPREHLTPGLVVALAAALWVLVIIGWVWSAIKS